MQSSCVRIGYARTGREDAQPQPFARGAAAGVTQAALVDRQLDLDGKLHQAMDKGRAGLRRRASKHGRRNKGGNRPFSRLIPPFTRSLPVSGTIGEGTALRADFRNGKGGILYCEFVLDHSIIKGLFLKVPLGAPNLSDVKRWYRSKHEEAVEKIEKYSVQNAVVYEYFYDKWVDFDEIMLNIPQTIADEAAFLRTHTYLEAADSSFCYLLNIDEFIPKGEIAPYEYVKPQVFEMLVNQRKVAFLKNFEEELYDDALRAGDVVFIPE